MKVLVTGGAGFIGSQVCEKLIANGEEVTIIDNLSTSSILNVPKDATFVKADILKIDKLRNDIGKQDVVIHLAAQTSVYRSENDPLFDLTTNIAGTTKVMQFSDRLGVSEFRFISSAAVYGGKTKLPISENAKCKPTSIYGISKFASEMVVTHFSKSHNLNAVIFRPANVYGPKQRNDLEGGVISIFLRNVRDGTTPRIYGNGRQTRDFVFVDDVAETVSRKIGKVKGVKTFNIGTSKQTSITEVLGMILSLSGYKKKKIRYLPARRGEILYSSLSNASLLRYFDGLEFISVESGIKKFIEQYKE